MQHGGAERERTVTDGAVVPRDVGADGAAHRLAAVAEQLAVPCLFSGSSVTDPHDAHRNAWLHDAQDRIAGSLWCRSILPALLGRIERELDALAESSRAQTAEEMAGKEQRKHDGNLPENGPARAEGLELLICAVAKFVTPRRVPRSPPTPTEPDYGASEPKSPVNDFSDLLCPDLIDSFVGNRMNRDRAEAIRDRALRLYASDSAASTAKSTPVASSFAISVLRTRIKPLFSGSSSTSSGINRETGRAKPAQRTGISASAIAHLDAASYSLDAPAWKGGGLSAVPMDGVGQAHAHAQAKACVRDVQLDTELQRSLAAADAGNLERLNRRHDGIGAHNLLAWAVSAATAAPEPEPLPAGHAASTAKRSEAQHDAKARWEAAWPLIIPPLLTLIDDSALYYRIAGVRILYHALLAPALAQAHAEDSLGRPATPSTAASAQAAAQAALPAAIAQLLRTGLAPLVASSLSASLAYLSDSLAPHALPDALAAARALALLTTAPSAVRFDAARSASASTHAHVRDAVAHVEEEGLVRRFDLLCKLINDGALQPWTYIRLSRGATGGSGGASFDIDGSSLGPQGDSEAKIHEVNERDLDVGDGNVSSGDELNTASVPTSTLAMLASLRAAQQLFRDVGPAGCARYLDVSAEFLSALLQDQDPLPLASAPDAQAASPDENESAPAPAIAQLVLLVEAAALLRTLVLQCSAHMSAPKADDADAAQEPPQPVPALPPNLEARASEMLFAAAAAWIKFDLPAAAAAADAGADAAASGAGRLLAARAQLAAELQSLAAALVRAMPRLLTGVVEDILALDQRMKALFAACDSLGSSVVA